MEYDLLLEKMKKKIPVYGNYGNQNLSSDLTDIRIITKNQNRFKKSTLYLSATMLLPDPSTPETITIFCYGDIIDFSKYKNSSFRILYFGQEISQAELFNFTSESMTDIPQVSMGMHILVNALFSGNGLQHLVDAAAEIFGNPVYVVDLQHKYLAISSGIFPDNPFYSKENESPYIREEGILYIRKNQLDAKVRKSKLPIYFFNEMVGHGTLICAIHIDGIEVGHIMLQESEHKFRQMDSELLYNFSRLVSIELQKNSVFTDNKGVMYSYFLADLLKNPNSNVKTVKNRLDTLGFKLKADLYLMTIPASSYHASNLKLEVILQNIKNILVGSLYVIYENSIVFLISKDKYQPFTEYELERLHDFLDTNHLKAGISNFFTALEEAPRFYKQALDAVKLGTHMGDDTPIYYYRDYYIYQMFRAYEKEDKELRYLIHPGLMQLHLYDQEKGTDFTETLRNYLISPGQPSVIAKNLHIHKNTLLYRMGKIKEITGCEFITGEDFMKFNLSFKIMAYLHML